MIRLPASFKPTHPTAGLPDYPAIDVFGDPNEVVTVGFHGTVRRISGKSCQAGGTPGGAYGQSLYIVSANGDDRYVTHLNKLLVKVGDKVKPGDEIATLCDSAVSGKPGTTHAHYGLNKSDKPLPPTAQLYDVIGPKGRRWVKHGTAKQVNSKWPGLAKRLGYVRIVHADTPDL